MRSKSWRFKFFMCIMVGVSGATTTLYFGLLRSQADSEMKSCWSEMT